ncbi:gliding motility-associated C-terminal domain-containing protein [Flavobacterium fluvii]|uniref:Gliding motility-associated C-terminal domain-containing protein n=1 Tax=Flavobacterium fluvii TaxID=468056 RepID=A0A1M5EXN4_9FLAO|nr:gliding motility-associated C-terminal domain-containing protein [Flavobacterium fluvii]SHF83782.1 gliding motility-associated C-terminal domain-containing protein [Flavobacterium fluvii]
MKISIVNKYFFCFLSLVFSLTTTINGQTIAPQTLTFSKICAGNYNQFDATFNHAGFPVSTTFEVQLSDISGSFTNPVSTTTLSTIDVTVSQKTVTFAVPTNLIGSENYKLRVKSSTGFVSGSFSIKDPNNPSGTLSFFPAYYKPFEDVYYINNRQSTATICTGGNVTLSIDNPTPSIPNSSPANYPNIKYKWYKGTTVISGQTGPSLLVNSAGTYYVAIDYASCTDSNSRSNSVTVSEASGGTSGAITSSLGNPFCSGGNLTTLSSMAGNSHQWYKDNVKINGATSATYTTNQAGLYSVAIDFGGCNNTYSIDLKEFKMESSINIPNPSVIIDGETKNVVVTTNAVNPTFQWYQNNTLIAGVQGNTYAVTSEGSYKVIVTQNSGCVIVDEIPFEVNSAVDSSVVEIPNLISPNNDGINDTWVIPQEYSVGSNTEVVIMSATGEVVFTSNNYLNNWPESQIDFKNVNPVYYYILTTQGGKVKKGSITLVK